MICHLCIQYGDQHLIVVYLHVVEFGVKIIKKDGNDIRLCVSAVKKVQLSC